jgi:D-beta-D-heptose 7-phosphate kinase/D-beta-D-heptose 1-phosphate adenosyltransferase
VEFVSESATLGGAGNVVTNITALGGNPSPFGFVGDDAPGRKLMEALRRSCPSASEQMLVDASRPTTVKRRIIAHRQQLLRIDSESRAPISEALHARLLNNLRRALPKLKAIVVSDYNKGAVSRTFFQDVLAAAEETGVPVVLDPKAFDLTDVGPATVITPNEHEAERLSGVSIRNNRGAEEAGERLLAKTGARHILITRGEHGMALFTAGSPPLHMPTQAREVYDVTGAGDTVVAALSLALAGGANVAEAAHLANFAAGVVVGKVGTATVSRPELESALAGVWPTAPNIKQLAHSAG